MSRISMVPTDRVAAHREGLLALSRALVVAHHGGTFSETLEIVLEALGADAGAAYEVEQAGLVLVAHRGLTMDLRVALERLPKTDDPWFIASRAAKSRRIVVEPDVAASTSNAEVAKLFTPTARVHAVAVPLVAGRQVLGVIVVFQLRPDAYDATVASFLETAAGMITLARSSQRAPVSAVRREEERMGPLAMAGMLAAHFADDVRGPLAAISLTLREQERILDRPDLPTDMLTPPLRQLIEEAQLALRRAQTVTDQIVSAAQAGPRERLVFADILKEAVRSATPMADSRGVLVMEHVEAEGHVFGRRAELVPAFVALLTNAVQACEHGPRTRRPTVKITTEEDPRGVAVSVEDTGAGVPADIRSRIFDPFFSTNAGAAGIGLTLAKHAIVGHSGHLEISVSPTLGGALFRAVLPRAAENNKKPQRRASSLSSATLRKVARGPSLLWIDRDVVFLAGARRALEGYEVRVAANAAEGEQLILHGVPAPEIIFCEIDLPDRSGLDLHADIARKSPELSGRFVFVTDGILSPERAAYVLGSGCPTLVKPLDLDDIRTLVQGASGDSPSSRKGVKTPPDVDDPFEL